MVSRRVFTAGVAASIAGSAFLGKTTAAGAAAPYGGPNVVIVRFGGGVRRAETISEDTAYAPYLRHRLRQRGLLIPDMRIAQLDGVETSHAEGTINILTGRYLSYRDRNSGALEDRLEPTRPTLFEYFQAAFAMAPHEALLINGEDRPQEEYLVTGSPGHKGAVIRSEMLSLHRFKLHKNSRILAEGTAGEEALARARAELDQLTALRPEDAPAAQSPEIERFWDTWRADYGDTGLVNPRGDRLLTELAVRAMRQLRPRLMMVNYQDTDYVHWGNASHYTRAIAIIDQGLERLVETADSDPFYRGNTVFVVVPDCGRDANSLMDVPFQHHFNSRSAHEIWALFAGPGIVKGKVLDKSIDQSAVAATVAAAMGFTAHEAEGDAIAEAFT